MIVKYSNTADRQLTDIWRYSRRQWGEAKADKYVAALYDAVRLAAAGRRHMQPRPDVRADLNMIRSGSHHIYVALEHDADVLHVVAILHQRMEPRRHIRKSPKGKR
jgi:toxin ParE1/3/4